MYLISPILDISILKMHILFVNIYLLMNITLITRPILYIERYRLSHCVCLSVRCCARTAKNIVEILSPCDSSVAIVFRKLYSVYSGLYEIPMELHVEGY